MFDVSSDDIALLNDGDLRELVGRLCEAELRSRGLSPSFVTYGGNQNAADGGLDVRVALSVDASIEGFVPRPTVGFQVKATNMPRSEIIAEMSPDGSIRDVILELEQRAGAYIIVSSKGSVADTPLRERRSAMAEVARSINDLGRLHVDFYDRTRLATWVRQHSGLVLWVRQKIGRAVSGWRPFENWACAPGGVAGTYLFDEQARIRIRANQSDADLSVIQGINDIRSELKTPGNAVRLIGLSGVGKTRLVQALFDERVGEGPLDPGLAVYTNMADNPDPQPVGFLSDLLALRVAAVLIVDNCPADLHRRLSELCKSTQSKISLITVEYDIQDGLPEDTYVFELKPSSVELIKLLLKSRFSSISDVDAHTAAEFSGGNARAAIALAQTVEGTGTLAGLSDGELFRRLFDQRQNPDSLLLKSAQALSLVYSFDGEDTLQPSELALLGSTVRVNSQTMYEAVAELRRRDLVQCRSKWRAILPHVIANRLAAQALQNIPPATIEFCLLRDAPERIVTSFTRRLGYLHGSAEAAALVRRLLSQTGFLGDVISLNDFGLAIFRNIAPVTPEVTLAAIERALLQPGSEDRLQNRRQMTRMLRSLAYDESLFERSARLMARLAILDDAKDEADDFCSLFSLYLSGTHASIGVRLAVIEGLIFSDDARKISLGLKALDAALVTLHFVSHHEFSFGAHSRDFGYAPKTFGERADWFRSTLHLCERVLFANEAANTGILGLVASRFDGICRVGCLDALEGFCQVVAQKRIFWPEGWAAVRSIQYFHSKECTPEILQRINSLEVLLRAKDTVQKVRATVFGYKFTQFDAGVDGLSGDNISAQIEFQEASARSLGRMVAKDDQALTELLPEIISADGRLGSFGAGLLEGADDPEVMWERLVSQFEVTEEDKRRGQVLCGFLHALNLRDSELAVTLLDRALESDSLIRYFPSLEASIGIGEGGFARLICSLKLGKTPGQAYQSLASGLASDALSGMEFKELVLGLASKTDGFDAAILLLEMRLGHGRRQGEAREEAVADAGREILRSFDFKQRSNNADFHLGMVARYCLTDAGDADIVRQMCRNFRRLLSNYDTNSIYHESLIATLFSVQPLAALDGLIGRIYQEAGQPVTVSDDLHILRANPFDQVDERVLLMWCDQDPKFNYPTAAAGVRIFAEPSDSIPTRWTNMALKILERAPDRFAIIDAFVCRLSPTSWWGSRAVILEAGAKLLDDLPLGEDEELIAHVAKAKVRLRQTISEEREFETIRDSRNDSSFE